jgi:geranylgeranyl diphosphate synthase type II
MDDARLRRGRPALHRRLGEDAAVLGAVALLNHAYAVIGADQGLGAETRLALQAEVSAAVGFAGLVSGQIRDLHECSALRDEAALTSLNRQKTSVLFVAAAVGGALIAGSDLAAQARAKGFADKLGLAFQLWDDLQDCTSSEEVMGKDARQDEGRITFVTLWGEERTREAVAQTLESALEELGERRGPLGEYTLNLFRAAGYGG